MTLRHILQSSVLAAAPAVLMAAQGFEVHVGDTVEISSSYRYCWYPTVHLFATGEILATMRMSPDEEHPEGEFSAYCISKDGGRTWSRRYPMGAGANIDDAYTQNVRPDNTVWVLGGGYEAVDPFPPGQTQQFHLALTKYARGGAEIAQINDAVLRVAQPAQMEPVKLFDLGRKDASKLEKAPMVTPIGAIIEGTNGDLLATVYYMTQKDPRRRRLVLARSADQGKTWNETSLIAGIEPGEQPWDWMGDEGPNENAIVRLADQRLYCIFRTGNGGFLGHVWSSDDGKTWTRPVSTGVKGVDPHIRRLSNGVLACTYGRPGPVTIMFSLDGTGSAWSHATEIFKGRSTSYTDLIEISPGKLFVVYDSTPYGGHAIPYSDRQARNTILGTLIETKR